jgi:hypothetical protein
MGYEVVYYYHEEIERGEYNKEETKEGMVIVGEAWEDVELDYLAGKVMALLARRSILVTSLEISEFKKKSVTFREAKDGIVIKNRKFKFDDGSTLKGESLEQSDPIDQLKALLDANPDLINSLGVAGAETASVPFPHESSQNTPSRKTHPQATAPSPKGKSQFKNAPLRYEVFDPVIDGLAQDAKRRGLRFTLGKKYPIYEEKAAGNQYAGMQYFTLDDNGNKQAMSDKFFKTETSQLIGDRERGVQIQDQSDSKLQWSGVIGDNMPSVR